MGKRILVQRKGQGTFPFRSPSHRHVGAVKYRPLKETEEQREFELTELIHSPGRCGPVAIVKYNDFEKGLYLPPEGVFEGEKFIQTKGEVDVKVGNIMPLGKVPIGTLVFNVEGIPQDGGKFARASGVGAVVRDKSGKKVELMFRSKKTKAFDEKCLCTIGVVAGGGRTDKPFMKAGNKFYHVRSKARKWPIVRGAAMNACSHPFGGGRHKHPHIPTTTARTAPPGRKVGLIAARRTGIRK